MWMTGGFANCGKYSSHASISNQLHHLPLAMPAHKRGHCSQVKIWVELCREFLMKRIADIEREIIEPPATSRLSPK